MECQCLKKKKLLFALKKVVFPVLRYHLPQFTHPFPSDTC